MTTRSHSLNSSRLIKFVIAVLSGLLISSACWPACLLGQDFVNWESPHVSPLDLTPNGQLLLAVNTSDNRLEIIDLATRTITGSVRVGLDPVSVRARNNTQAWVVNHISDSISLVDLSTAQVTQTLYPGNEPCDVVFAGNPERAFVSVSEQNQIAIFDLADLTLPPQLLTIEGEEPRALATDGTLVYVAVFASGTATTSLNERIVSDSQVNPYPGNPNPPPNSGNNQFQPPIAEDLPTPPPTSMIVKKSATGQWLDDNGFDWSAAVSHDLHDQDVAIVNANSLSIEYATGLMNANMALTVVPGGGAVIVGTDAINEVRFEPNLQSHFVRVKAARIAPDGSVLSNVDLNPHINYSQIRIPAAERMKSLGDPRGVAWSPEGSELIVSGMGSGNIVVHDPSITRTGRIVVGNGPTGVRVDSDYIYVLNKFDGTVSVVDRSSATETEILSFHDPTPTAIRDGRPFLYDTHLTSGLGQASCASCHLDGGMDHLGWDLGNPQGQMKEFNQTKVDVPGTDVEDWHPMKGPMATQTLFGLATAPPFHWRGDREDIAAFNPAFVDLLGADAELSAEDIGKLNDFIMSLTFPPNPHRNVDGTLPTTFHNGGDAANGEALFQTGQLVVAFNCIDCHGGPPGTDGKITPQVIDMESQSMKTPQLRNMHEKVGRDDSSQRNNLGFGFIHDGSIDTMQNFLDIFNFPNQQAKLDVEAFMMCFSTDTFAAIGSQVTVPNNAPGARLTVADLINLAGGGNIEVIASGIHEDESRGFAWIGGNQFQSDRLGQIVSLDDLLAGATLDSPITFTAVPAGASERMALDRDRDGYFDGDERDSGSNEADPNSAMRVTRGILRHGGFNDSSHSDNLDLTITRNLADLQSEVELRTRAVSPVANPSQLAFTFEAAVFARVTVNQRISLFNFNTGQYEEIDLRPASRFLDQTVVATASGDLSRFVEPGTNFVEAQVTLISISARQNFSTNIDFIDWTITP